MLQGLLRGIMAAAVASSLFGCAEFTNRGGIVDSLEDVILFRADTKSHRALRSYVMVGALISLAQRGGVSSSDYPNLVVRINTTLLLAREAFECAYESHNGCIFFDEKMARLDSSILRLALLTLFDSETKEFYDQIHDKLVQDIPVLGAATKSVQSAIRLLSDVTLTAAQGAEVIDSLARLGLRALRKASRVTPLYRDAMEMDMVVIVDYLGRHCEAALGTGQLGRYLLYRDYVGRMGEAESCQRFKFAYELYNEGNGKLGSWIEYVHQLNGTLQFVGPTADHFISVSRLIWSSCMTLKTILKPDLVWACLGKPDDLKDKIGDEPTVEQARKFYLLFAEYLLGNRSGYVARLNACRLSRDLKLRGKGNIFPSITEPASPAAATISDADCRPGIANRPG
jgi:hypothetical protein